MSNCLKPTTCPNCGAGFKIDKNSVYAECPYCGSEFKIDDPVQDQIRLKEAEMDQKIRWMKENEQSLNDKAKRDDLVTVILTAMVLIVLCLMMFS